MHNDTVLKLSAIAFAVLWTAGMWWWPEPADRIPLAILIVVGALAGVLWYWLFGKWLRWFVQRQKKANEQGS